MCKSECCLVSTTETILRSEAKNTCQFDKNRTDFEEMAKRRLSKFSEQEVLMSNHLNTNFHIPSVSHVIKLPLIYALSYSSQKLSWPYR